MLMIDKGTEKQVVTQQASGRVWVQPPSPLLYRNVYTMWGKKMGGIFPKWTERLHQIQTLGVTHHCFPDVPSPPSLGQMLAGPRGCPRCSNTSDHFPLRPLCLLRSIFFLFVSSNIDPALNTSFSTLWPRVWVIFTLQGCVTSLRLQEPTTSQ